MKLTEENLLEFRCELEELITAREGMIAENQQRIQRGESLAYVEQMFFENVEQKTRDLRERIIRISEAPEPAPLRKAF